MVTAHCCKSYAAIFKRPKKDPHVVDLMPDLISLDPIEENIQPVTFGKTLKLADDDYELVTLDSKEATEKYGDKGLYGAAEISRKQ